MHASPAETGNSNHAPAVGNAAKSFERQHSPVCEQISRLTCESAEDMVESAKDDTRKPYLKILPEKKDVLGSSSGRFQEWVCWPEVANKALIEYAL